MNTAQFYEQSIKPLSSKEKLTIARLILSGIETIEPEKGFASLKRMLPNIERISLTDEDLAQVKFITDADAAGENR